MRSVKLVLRTPLERVELNGVPFDDAIDILQKSSGIGISANWKALADAGVVRKSPVFLHTRGVPLSSVLDALFANPIHGVDLGFTLEDGMIKISTRLETAKTTITRIYDVRDFIAQAQPPERQQAIYNIAKFIIDTVDPDSWRDNNGSVGTIGVILPTRGRLIVTQSWSNHERIAASLLTLRKNGCGLALRYHESDSLR